jgi:hypothetical protein
MCRELGNDSTLLKFTRGSVVNNADPLLINRALRLVFENASMIAADHPCECLTLTVFSDRHVRV